MPPLPSPCCHRKCCRTWIPCPGHTSCGQAHTVPWAVVCEAQQGQQALGSPLRPPPLAVLTCHWPSAPGPPNGSSSHFLGKTKMKQSLLPASSFVFCRHLSESCQPQHSTVCPQSCSPALSQPPSPLPGVQPSGHPELWHYQVRRRNATRWCCLQLPGQGTWLLLSHKLTSGQHSQAHGPILGGAARSQDLEAVIPVGPQGSTLQDPIRHAADLLQASLACPLWVPVGSSILICPGLITSGVGKGEHHL